MNELTRMQYLDAMGVETFVPRRILPAAQLSTVCELPVEWIGEALADDAAVAVRPSDASTSHEQVGVVSGAGVGAVAPPVPDVVKNLLEPSSLIREEKPSTPLDDSLTLQQVVSQKRPAQLRFSLSVWNLANGVVFIDTRSPKAALPTPTLLQNILHAFDPTLVAPKPDIIQWPLLESPVANPNEAREASEMVNAFLASRFEVTAPKLLVAMGKTAFSMLIAPADKTEADFTVAERLQAAHLPCDLVVLPSLTELLQQPLLKRHIWPLLKPAFS